MTTLDDTPNSGSSISAWTLCTSKIDPTDPPHSKFHYERLLGPNELGFYWDSVYQGTADTLQHAIVEELSKSQLHSAKIQSEENVRAAWVTLKSRYPLLGARIEERPTLPAVTPPDTGGMKNLSSKPLQSISQEEVYFVVDPVRLTTTEPPYAHSQEVVFLSCASEEEAVSLAEGIANGFEWQDVQAWGDGRFRVQGEPSSSRLLSNSLPACLLFIRRTDNGIGNSTILSEYLDLLARGGNRDSFILASVDNKVLEERLKLSISSEALYPDQKSNFSRARRRWHRVLGKILLALRNAKMKGGHSLPRILRPSTTYTPAKSSFLTYAFNPSQTLYILRRCRELGITFGNAYPVLGQLAVSRILLRRRLRTLSKKRQGIQLSPSEDIDDEEWIYRRRQPMMTGGPANLRPYLDQDWYSKGGVRNVCLSISFFFFTLPFMPLGEVGFLADGESKESLAGDIQMPMFGKMLSRKRFLLRCISIRKQSSEVFRHPRFLDVHAARVPMRIERCRTVALTWRRDSVRPDVDNNALIPVLEQPEAAGGAVITHGGSSFGNSDHLVPPFYPHDILFSKSTPNLRLVKSTTRLRCRPIELYLGASTARGQLNLDVFWDENVYTKEVVEEWLDEVRAATEWFLGTGEDQSGNTQFGKGEGVTPPVTVMTKL